MTGLNRYWKFEDLWWGQRATANPISGLSAIAVDLDGDASEFRIRFNDEVIFQGRSHEWSKDTYHFDVCVANADYALTELIKEGRFR